MHRRIYLVGVLLIASAYYWVWRVNSFADYKWMQEMLHSPLFHGGHCDKRIIALDLESLPNEFWRYLIYLDGNIGAHSTL